MEMTMGHLTIHNYHNLQKQMDRWKWQPKIDHLW